jgi:ribonuclease P protein component
MQWFRFYTEAISDKKLRRIARDNNESMAHVIGVWTIVLSMASDSPERGKLLISDEVPATIDDINDAAGCNVTATFQKLLVTGLVTVTVTDDGQNVYEVPAWERRQFESDSSATRVRRHRERKKAAQNDANVTPAKRYSNAPDTDTDTDTDIDPIVVVVAPTPPELAPAAEPAPTLAAAPAKEAAPAAVFRCWQDNMPGTLTTLIADDVGDLIDTYGADAVIRAIGEAARANVRNLVKRIAREIFRRQRIELPAMDLVVRLNAPVAKATRAEINLDLLSLLQRLPRQ